MSESTCSCGAIDIQYTRSGRGRPIETVHRVGCRRASTSGTEWHYAETELENDHQRVLAKISELPWFKACSYCMTQETP